MTSTLSLFGGFLLEAPSPEPARNGSERMVGEVIVSTQRQGRFRSLEKWARALESRWRGWSRHQRWI